MPTLTAGFSYHGRRPSVRSRSVWVGEELAGAAVPGLAHSERRAVVFDEEGTERDQLVVGAAGSFGVAQDPFLKRLVVLGVPGEHGDVVARQGVRLEPWRNAKAGRRVATAGGLVVRIDVPTIARDGVDRDVHVGSRGVG